jgi:hypothetical protein
MRFGLFSFAVVRVLTHEFSMYELIGNASGDNLHRRRKHSHRRTYQSLSKHRFDQRNF